jgi:uncharacterized protein (TIGR02001 family)
MFKKALLAGAVAAAVMPFAASAADEPASPHTFTSNVGLYSQYVFRGLTQTNREPAIQGGFDYSHASGFYAGTWASNISWLRDSAAYRAGGSAELDFYGGFKGAIGKSDFSYDLGTLYYYYPGDVNTPANVLNVKADTWELYGSLGYKWVTAKVSYAVSSDVFGVRDAGGTYYFDLSATYPVTKELSLIAHWGQQKYTGQDPRNIGIGNNDTLFSYSDWKLGASYSLPKDFTVGAYYTDTSSADVRGYGTAAECVGAVCGVYPRNIAKGTGTVFISKTF